ncbi:hypothetical protein JXL21_09645 [Candidatus Bathyarchaeota archaeon]|nr:hypothetical protein [Candidatus Bathyarchaeota archaeon]
MASLLDMLVLGFGLIFYLLLVIVYFFRAYEKSEQELRLKYVFSAQLIPFTLLFVAHLVSRNQIRQSITLIPMLAFLGYDLWYRVLSENKPGHHPDKWPKELIIYLVLLMLGSIGLNWYGYTVSETYGRMLVAAYFVMMGSFGFYQFKHNQRKKQSKAS